MTSNNPVSETLARLPEIIEQNSSLQAENTELRESIAEVKAMMDYEDRGWQAIFGFASGDRTEGLDLEEVKTISEKARPKVAAASLEKRASDLHGGYVFGKGMEIEKTERDPNRKGAPTSEVRFYEDVINQESLFSDGAVKELQRARFTDGNVIVFCYTKEKRARRVPIYEISGVMTNPDFPEEIWAWMRSWTSYDKNNEPVEKKAWVYSNRFTGTRVKYIQDGDERVEVLEGVTAVDLRVNRQVGWAFGVPDAVAGMLWTEAYGQVLHYGRVVNESLAKVLFKVVNKKTAAGAANVGVKMANFNGHGGTATLGEGQDIALVNSGQRSFDFTAPRPLAAMAASAWNVSNIDLLSDSSAAGSSYGAAKSLTEGVLNAMTGMQKEWTQFYQDVFQAFGMDRPVINWPPMETPDPYREAQQLKLYQDALQPEEYRAEVLDRLNIPGNANDIPEALEMASKPQVQAAPNQGVANGTGGDGSTAKNDQRTDTQENLRHEVALENLAERLEAAVRKAEELNLAS